jgi:hypothetical protein
MSADPLDLARTFLVEAVYRSRNSQGLSSVFAEESNCGLGEGPVSNLDLSDKAQAIFKELWPGDMGEAQLDAIRATTRAWVERSDSLDRDRNHFLKAFRKANGFDRTSYTTEQLTEYEAGLEGVNSTVDAALSEAATVLLETSA